MASIRKLARGWRAEVYRKGIRRSKVLPTKREAQDWAAREEYLITNDARVAADTPFSEALERYAREVSPAKRGHRWEALRLARFQKDEFASKRMCDLTAQDFAGWRDRRLRDVSAGSVRREMVLLSAVLSVARKEWGMISESPMRDVRKPAQSPARDRLPTKDEFERLAHSAGDDLSTMLARSYHAFLFSCETAMRAGEVLGLRWEDVDGPVARLPMTKNGTAREVPLSSEALRLLDALRPYEFPRVFGLSSQQLDANWRKLRGRAGVEGLRYHDSRHYAISHLAHKLDVLSLARMVGHRNIGMLQVYYNESAKDMAGRLG